MNRADLTHDLIESVWGDVPEMAPHEPVLRPDAPQRVTIGCRGASCQQGRRPCTDGCNVVPLKEARVQVDRRPPWMVELANGQTTQRPQPASMDPISTAGERALLVLGKCVLGVFAIIGMVHVATRIWGPA